MDDKRFDNIIKQKAESFKDTGHDAHALTDLRSRLSNLPTKTSNWSTGKMAYVAGSLLLFTLINAGIIWYFSEGRHSSLNHELAQLKEERSQFISLHNKSSQLEGRDYSKTDTIYIYRDLVGANSSRSANVIYQPETANIEESEQYLPFAETSSDLNEYHALLANDSELSEELERFLTDNNLLLTGDHGEMILVVHSTAVAPINEYGLENSYIVKSRMPENLTEISTYEAFEQFDRKQKVEKKKIPTKALWAMEKHNHKGVDFQFGFEGKYHKSNYDVGSGERSGGIGLLTEIIFSPVLRLETGLHFGARAYKLGEEEINQLPPEFFDDYPGYNDQLGKLSSLESDAELIQVPLNLKVFGILDHNKKWYVSGGLTPQWARKQEFDYKYSLTVPDLPVDGEFSSFVGAKQEVSIAYYTTTVNLGVGTEIKLNEKLRWQLGLFYQRGLSDAGYENRKLKNSFGVKSSIWFNRP